MPSSSIATISSRKAEHGGGRGKAAPIPCALQSSLVILLPQHPILQVSKSWCLVFFKIIGWYVKKSQFSAGSLTSYFVVFYFLEGRVFLIKQHRWASNSLFFFWWASFNFYLILFLVFRDRVSLCSPGLTHSVDQAGLKLRDLTASASQVLGLKACTTTAWPEV